MNETRYMISDTAKQVEVEAHVLRYWEEELELQIGRNEMGHRYYTGENIQLFRNIKELKEQGFQLKAIKMLLPELDKQEAYNMDNIINLKDELNRRAFSDMNTSSMPSDDELLKVETMVASIQEDGQAVQDRKEVMGLLSSDHSDIVFQEEPDSKLQQFEMIIGDIITQIIKGNNKELSKEVGTQVSDNVIKEMDYLMRIQEEREEERYKRLDETIRIYQDTRRHVAATNTTVKKKIKFKKPGLFKRRKNRNYEIGD